MCMVCRWTRYIFHEVGNLDAIADIVGVCILIEMISAQKIIVSPVHVEAAM